MKPLPPRGAPAYPNDALGMIVSILSSGDTVVLSPYLLSASQIALGVLHAQGSALEPHRVPVLAVLKHCPGISQVELARHLGVERVTAGKYVQEALDAGLVERKRSEDDARRFTLFLTAKAEALLAQLNQAAPQVEDLIATGLSGEERAELRRLLVKLVGGSHTEV